MPILAPTVPSSSNRHEQVIWTRLHLGHTRLTHRHLLFGEPPPYSYTEDTICVGLRKIGSDDQKIIAAPLRRMATVDLGPPLHSLIICSDLHPIEKDMLELFVEEKGCLDACSPVESTV
ncbi:diphthine methyl ester synthase [Trichonephila clavata]|uniref:Diphthine methyl ester synthase n=1 Tax=Trichonephila clavata TaxID=2740835 RepID=A0A8X6F9Y1_TRICU|nr:diphthine methyl ester synthase [Trichonephila clavata]